MELFGEKGLIGEQDFRIKKYDSEYPGKKFPIKIEVGFCDLTYFIFI